MENPHQREVAAFEAALQLPPERREAYLDQVCGGDAELRRRVGSLLKAHQSETDLIEPTAATLGSSFPREVLPTEKPGDRIGRYKLLQQIGEGGCGVVYMAEQDEPIRRRVALKVIKLGMDTKSVIGRFEAERQALALMDHPNIAKVLDAGATETGRPFFVMELVRGTKITDYCDQNNLSTPERLDLFIQICHAVQHAHQKGVIHRDLKPSNILVTVNDGVAVPKVIDFGIAKATQGRLTDQTVFTAFEQFIGTPAYMSPEQAVLTSVDIDTRSDIYSLGVLLYELLTGRTPFDQKELLAAGLDEMRRTIREKEPLRPSTCLSTMAADALKAAAKYRQSEVSKLIHLVHGDLDWIVMKCLEKDRGRRYETANGLASDIRRHLNCEPVVARPPSRLYEFQKTVRRHKFGFGAAAAIIIVLTIGVLVSTWQSVRATRAKAQAEVEKQLANRVTAFMQQMLATANPHSSKSPGYTVREMLDDFAPAIDTQFPDNPEVAAELHATLGEAYWNLQEEDKAKRQLARALELCAAVYGTNSVNYADSLAAYGGTPSNFATDVAEFKEGETYLRRALAIYRERGIKGQRVIHALWSLQVIFDYEDYAGKWDEMEGLVTQAQAEARQSPGTNYWEVLAMNIGLVQVKTQQGKYLEAETIAHETIAEETRLFGPDYFETAWAYLRLTDPLLNQSKYAEALAAAQKAVAIMRKRISPDQIWYGDSLRAVFRTLAAAHSARALTNLCSSADDLDKLEALFQERLGFKPLAPDNFGDPVNVATRTVPQFPALYLELASELSAAGRTNEAAECRRKAATQFEQLQTQFEQLQTQYAGNPDLLAQLYLSRIQSSVAQGQMDEAKAYREKLLALKPHNASLLNDMAWTLATSANPGLRDGSIAVFFAEQAVAATGRTNGVILDTLAAAYAEAGQFDKAVAAENESIARLTAKKAIDGFTTRLNLYQTNTPYREP
jgi:serine/threonine protein kinase/tetratricopeptide (TPR) repeat protein